LPGRGSDKNNQIVIINLMEKFSKLSRVEMKNVLGGNMTLNPNCEGTEGTYDFTCCTGTASIHLGDMTCDDASMQCNGGMVTNDPDRCNQ